MAIHNKNFSLDKLSVYRTELMGVATIMILICHASVNGVIMSDNLRKLLSLGNLGVEIFFLMSGIGICYSLEKNKSLIKWYSKRYVRILLPYFVIAIPAYAISWYINRDGLFNFLLNISTMNYWLYHRGAWFIAILLPLYMVSPILKQFLTGRYSLIWLIILVLITSLVGLIKIDGVIGNIIFAIHRLPLYFVGMYLFPFIKSSRGIRIWQIVLIGVAVMFILRSIDIGVGWLWPSVIIAVPVMCYLMELFPKICRFLNIFGGISLESYLLNICLCDLIPKFPGDFNGVCRYSLIVSMGIALSLIINRYIANPAIRK